VHEHDPDLSARIYAALALSILGHPDRAMQRMDEALELGQQRASPWNRAFTLGFAAMFHHIRREVGRVLERAEEAIEIAEKQGFPYWLGLAMVLRGWARAESGAGRSALEEILQGIEYGASSGTRIGGCRMLGIVAEARRHAGLLDEALSTLDVALALAAETGSRFWEAELHRLRGETLLERDPAAEAAAERCLEHAAAVAKAQQAHTLELRAISSLARLRRGQGRGQTAAALLVGSYGWFREGFDTPDLREARELLSELSGGVEPPAASA
jgi:adenylate cyclase